MCNSFEISRSNKLNLKTNTLILHDYIDDITSKEVADWFTYLPKKEPVKIKINSDGGSLYDVQSIIAELLLRKTVKIDITGCAFSGAAMIALTGTEIKMSKLGLFMLHYPVWNNGDKGFPEHKKSVENTEEHFDRIMKRLLRGKKKPHMTAAMLRGLISDKNLYLTPKECLRYGLVHKLY